jgi:uncharacterized membrane-anchored protein YhcB (DUF1043 family)
MSEIAGCRQACKRPTLATPPALGNAARNRTPALLLPDKLGVYFPLYFYTHGESVVEASGYSLGVLLTVGAALAIVGIVLGWLGGRRTSSVEKKYRDVALKLEQVTQDKVAYEADVVEHFTETARLLNNLTESYREVHNHLAQGAATLCNGAGPVSLERLEERTDPTQIPADFARIQPPLDYAPKSSPDEKGMLNEEFGLERKPLSALTD